MDNNNYLYHRDTLHWRDDGIIIVLYDYNGSNEMQWDRFGIDNMDIGFVQGVFWFPNDIQWETHFFGNQDGIC